MGEFPFHPRPVNDLSGDLDGINSNPSLVVMMEACDDDDQEAAEAALENVARAEIVRDSGRVYIFTAKGGGPASKVREMAQLPKVPSDEPVMRLLDCVKGGFYTPAEKSSEVTAENVERFLKDFRD